MSGKNGNGERVVRDEVITRTPCPGSSKMYVSGTIHGDVRVPMREVACSATRSQLPGGTDIENAPVTL